MKIKHFNKDEVTIDSVQSLAKHFNHAHIHMWLEGYGTVATFVEVKLLKALAPILSELLDNKERDKKVITINIIQEIQKLSERYDKQLFKRLFDTLAFFNKTKFTLKNQHSILSFFSEYRKEVVEESIKQYLDKSYAKQGKNFAYLRAMIKNLDQTYTKDKLDTDLYIQVKNEFLPITREYNRLKNPDYTTKSYYGIQLKQVESNPTLQIAILTSKIENNNPLNFSDLSDIEMIIAYILYNQNHFKDNQKLKYYFDLWKQVKENLNGNTR